MHGLGIYHEMAQKRSWLGKEYCSKKRLIDIDGLMEYATDMDVQIECRYSTSAHIERGKAGR